MESNKNQFPKREEEEDGESMSGWDEFWITIRWALVVAGIVGIIFIMSQCDTNAFDPSPPIDRCFSACSNSYSGNQEIDCLGRCQNIFGNQTDMGVINE